MDLPYQPVEPQTYRPRIGLIGCGWVTEYHLKAYTQAGYDVAALCDCDEVKAIERQKQFYPRAAVYTDANQLLSRDDIDVVDIATHPAERVALIESALNAGKHVLSQKPFVLDLDTGERLVALAKRKNRKLAVNQNGRWAPHWSYLRQLVAGGHLGDVMSAHLAVHWDHNWTAGTPFDKVHHLILYDFAIHWFDIVTQFLPHKKALRVYASHAIAPGQRAKPPLLGQVSIEFEQNAQATLVFDGSTPFGPLDTTFLAGTLGSARSEGADLNAQRVTVTAAAGEFQPQLQGSWFREGFHGTMAELLCAIEEDREPNNSAGGNLASLALCFAAVKSADTGSPQTPGEVRRVESL
ncbi:MAG: hypothetical protein QOF78_3443 [Phycisphaerales bacterium]|jgi:predicted dehydrogenase|nr:hypothetical protein [Phycisphaerales bacterium]